MKEIYKLYYSTTSTQYGYRKYEVSNLGNVKINGAIVDFSTQENNRYYGVGTFYVHRAVAELFIPNPENKPQVDHINTNKHDNRAVNLRWVTRKENMNNPLTLKKNKESHIGQNAWNKGIKGVSEESSNKMKEAWKHRLPDSEETRRKKSEGAKNRKPDSEETRRKKSKNAKGNKYSANHKWMTNSNDLVYPHISECDYWIKLGYHFGRK